MSYFADLTPHTYTPTEEGTVLNVGWLDSAYPFAHGKTSPEFHDALRRLCEHPVKLHRGFHQCQFCAQEDLAEGPPAHPERLGNGQIRVKGADGIWYAAPTMVCHYVTEHQYLPPPAFVEAVLRPAAVAVEEDGHQPYGGAGRWCRRSPHKPLATE